MPVYEYLCKHCATKFEELVFAGETAPERCPHCGAEKVSRLLSTFAAASEGGGKSSPAPADYSSANGHGCGGGSCACRQ